MYQPGAIVEFFRDLSLIQSARFMARLFAIRLLLTFFFFSVDKSFLLQNTRNNKLNVQKRREKCNKSYCLINGSLDST